jgi:hypothetical protein
MPCLVTAIGYKIASYWLFSVFRIADYCPLVPGSNPPSPPSIEQAVASPAYGCHLEWSLFVSCLLWGARWKKQKKAEVDIPLKIDQLFCQRAVQYISSWHWPKGLDRHSKTWACCVILISIECTFSCDVGEICQAVNNSIFQFVFTRPTPRKEKYSERSFPPGGGGGSSSWSRETGGTITFPDYVVSHQALNEEINIWHLPSCYCLRRKNGTLHLVVLFTQ